MNVDKTVRLSYLASLFFSTFNLYFNWYIMFYHFSRFV